MKGVYLSYKHVIPSGFISLRSLCLCVNFYHHKFLNKKIALFEFQNLKFMKKFLLAMAFIFTFQFGWSQTTEHKLYDPTANGFNSFCQNNKLCLIKYWPFCAIDPVANLLHSSCKNEMSMANNIHWWKSVKRFMSCHNFCNRRQRSHYVILNGTDD